MNKNTVNLKGKVFGQLTVVQYMGRKSNGVNTTTAVWLCQCSCGEFCTRTRAGLNQTKLKNYESVCSHACPKRTMVVNKKKYIPVSERVDASALMNTP
nr:hypothetical protein BHI3_07830 [Bacteriovorax sp. HI3]